MTKHTPLFVDLFSYLLRFRINGFTICEDDGMGAGSNTRGYTFSFFLPRIYFSCFKDVLRGQLCANGHMAPNLTKEKDINILENVSRVARTTLNKQQTKNGNKFLSQ